MAALPFAVVPLALSSIETGNARANRPASHLGAFKYPGMVWQSNGAADLWVRGSVGAATEIDFVAVLSANAGPTTDIRVRLDDETINAQTGVFDSGAVDFIDPPITREDGLYHSHLELGSPVTASHWRIDISNHSGDFEAAALVIGKKLTPATWYSKDFERGVEDLGAIDLTRWGVPDETPGMVFRTLALTFGWLSEVDYEAKFGALAELLGKRGVSLWCFDPAATAYRQSKTYFGYFSKPPYATGGEMPGKIQSNFQLLSMI